MLKSLETTVTLILRAGRAIASVLIGLMVVIILIQVFFRYVLNNALPWPDEAARFLMLWMTGFMAPSAYRWGGFVAIDILSPFFGRRLALFQNLFLLVVSLFVLVLALQLGWKHINSGWLFNSGSLKLPLGLIGLETVRVKLAWMYMSLPVGFFMMTVVNIEMILKNVHMILDPDVTYGVVPDQLSMSAE